MMKTFKLFLLSLAAIVLLSRCSNEEPSLNLVNLPSGKGYERLSDYNFFSGDLADLIPNSEAGVLPYDLNTALFSDYALKKRFIYVPEGSAIPFDTTKTLDLPVGSVLIKHFYYESEEVTNYIETRLLIRKEDKWQPETYKWNEEQTEAFRTVLGGTEQLSVVLDGEVQNFSYTIPNQNQCINCHAYDGKIYPIGPDISNLNKDYYYGEEGVVNQLEMWRSRGILETPSYDEVPAWPAIDDETATLDSRARAYLAINCSSCHRREGSAANSGLYLGYNNQDSLSIGFWKTPVAAGAGSGGHDFVIRPGSAETSILYYRMESVDVEARMPEIGRELLHKEGLKLIKDWIDGMKN